MSLGFGGAAGGYPELNHWGSDDARRRHPGPSPYIGGPVLGRAYNVNIHRILIVKVIVIEQGATPVGIIEPLF